MEPIPKPLLRRLVLTFLVGTGCFFTGLVFFLHEGDTSFFILSILLFAGSAVKAILLGLQIKRKTYLCWRAPARMSDCGFSGTAMTCAYRPRRQ